MENFIDCILLQLSCCGVHHTRWPKRHCAAPVPYCEMCSACVLDSFSMAARMAVMPPSTRIDSVEKLVCAPVPAIITFRLQGMVSVQLVIRSRGFRVDIEHI